MFWLKEGRNQKLPGYEMNEVLLMMMTANISALPMWTVCLPSAMVATSSTRNSTRTHTHMQKKTASLSFPSAPRPMVLAISCDRAAQIRRISCPCHRMCPWGNLLCHSDKATTRWMGNIGRSIVSRCDHNLQCHNPDDTRKSPWASSFCELVCFW